MVPDVVRLTLASTADDWVYWTYAPLAWAVAVAPAAAARGRALGHYARAVYKDDVAVSIAWGAAEPDEVDHDEWPGCFAELAGGLHWIDLLLGDLAVERFLAVGLAGRCASLPAPRVERRDDGDTTLWVSRRKHAVVRLANAIDPRCSDFDRWFELSGIEVR